METCLTTYVNRMGTLSDLSNLSGAEATKRIEQCQCAMSFAMREDIFEDSILHSPVFAMLFPKQAEIGLSWAGDRTFRNGLRVCKEEQ